MSLKTVPNKHMNKLRETMSAVKKHFSKETQVMKKNAAEILEVKFSGTSKLNEKKGYEDSTAIQTYQSIQSEKITR